MRWCRAYCRKKRLRIFALATCLLSITLAQAADLPPWESDLSPVPVARWRGLYAGAEIGTVGLTSSFNLIDFPENSLIGQIPTNVGSLGWGAGLRFGYNEQVGALVFGFEQDLLLAIPAVAATTTPFDKFGDPFTLIQSQTINWLSTLRGRIGVSPDNRTLIYATGGAAFAGVTTASNVGFVFNGQSYDLRAGWAGGGGVEYALTNDLSVSLDYLYFDVGASTVVAQANVATLLETHDRAQLSGQIIKAGFNYRFDAGPPTAGNSLAAPFAMAGYADDFQVELGARYWYSTGKTQKNLYDPTGSFLNSRLTYSGTTGYSGETFFRVDHNIGLFFKGFAGIGRIDSGTLKDEDFPPVISPYSATLSAQQDGSLIYGVGDVGYNVLRGPNYKLGPFVGYYRDQDVLNAYGCTQIATNPSVCVPAISTGTLGITENDTWQALRLGLNGQLTFFDRFRLDLDGAWLPYAWLTGSDTHWLRIQNLPGNFTGPIPEDGSGMGVQLEAAINYFVTEAFSVGVGARYWYVATHGNTNFEGRVIDEVASLQPTPFVTERYGAFVQGAYHF
jgi:opacity protein-like surface antigen